MKHLFTLVLTGFFALTTAGISQGQIDDPAPASAANSEQSAPILDAFDINLGDFLWLSRVLVVFTDTPNDPRLAEQIAYFNDGLAGALERDLVLVVDSDPAAKSPLRERLRPRGFSLVLIDKDGTKILRKASPWHLRELGRVIDKTTIRQQELRKSRGE